jgi:Cu/Ag efflux pump CusA
MAVRALMKTWMVLLIMPFFAICAIGSIFVMRYNLVVSVLGGVIALFSIYAEAVAFRLFFQEFSHFSNMFQRRRFQSGEAK